MSAAGRTYEQNVAAGRKKQDVGEVHEAWCKDQHDVAHRLGLVGYEVQHNQPRVIETDRGLLRVGVSVSDYTGFIADGYARTLAVEAKAVSGKYLRRSVVSVVQASYLDAVVACGGMSLLCAGFKDGVYWRRFCVPWKDVPWTIARSAEGVTAELLKPWEVPTDETCYLARFCDYFVPMPRVPTGGRVFRRE